MVSIKQMNYEEEIDAGCVKILANSFYKGFEFFILNIGGHPTAYINIGFKDHRYTNKEWSDEDEIFFPVHGGITFHKRALKPYGNYLALGDIIGWDYAHSSDRTKFDEYGEEHTTYEILLEIFDAINYLING